MSINGKARWRWALARRGARPRVPRRGAALSRMALSRRLRWRLKQQRRHGASRHSALREHIWRRGVPRHGCVFCSATPYALRQQRQSAYCKLRARRLIARSAGAPRRCHHARRASCRGVPLCCVHAAWRRGEKHRRQKAINIIRLWRQKQTK